MSESSIVCKKMSQDDYLKMIENNPVLKEKLDKIGISENEDGLSVRLNYSDLLTKEEKENLDKEYPSFAKSKEFFVKYGKKEGWTFACFTDEICENCHEGLLNYRKKYKEE